MSLPSGFSQEAVAGIRQRLSDIEATGVNIPLAIESGSRAWGFPSPDSDYDCRFIYIRSVRDHLQLEMARDVIEFPIVGEIDTGGWDLKKALLLAFAGNAVVAEWAKSPITYQQDERFRKRLLAVLDEIIEPEKVSRHYLGLARSHLSRVGSLGLEVKLKKLFYLIRPIVALDWMAQHDFQRLPPMNIIECLSDLKIDEKAKLDILDLIEKKKLTREMGLGSVPAALKLYLESRYGFHELNMPRLEEKVTRKNSTRFAVAQEFYTNEVALFSELTTEPKRKLSIFPSIARSSGPPEDIWMPNVSVTPAWRRALLQSRRVPLKADRLPWPDRQALQMYRRQCREHRRQASRRFW